jgi:hypothetical protein
MNCKKFGVLSAICAVLVVASGCLPRRGDQVLDTWETTNGAMKIRVRKFDEKRSVILPHAYFSFEATDAGAHKWREILAWRTDEGAPIRREQVQVVSNRVVCAFARTKYVVTTDAGYTWLVWDAVEKVPHLPYPLQTAIKEARVSSDGSGKMVLNYRAENGFTLGELNTTDYGVHWQMK